MLSDLNKDVARSYGILANEGIAFRGTFLIDKEGKLRHQTVNDMGIGRSVTETLRLIDAVNFHDEHGEVCPADFKPGDASINTKSDASIASYFKRKNQK